MSPVPPAGARRAELSSPRSRQHGVGAGVDKLAPIKGTGMGGLRGGSIADTIAGARASLKNPSRPFTPADPLRRLSAHSLLPRGEHGPAPPTPLIETSNFEGERPFTQHRLKTPLPATGVLAGSLGALNGPPLGAGSSSVRGVGHQKAEVLSLDDDESEEMQVPSQRPSLHSERIGSAARMGKSGARDDSASSASVGTPADTPAASVWSAIELQLPVLIKKGRASGAEGNEASRVMAACDAVMVLVNDFETVQSLSTEQRSTVVKAAAGCLEMKEPVQLMAKVGKVILAVTKGGANLLAVAKLLFRLSKAAANDEILRAEGVCDAVVGALQAGGRLESVLGHIARLSDQCEQEVEAVMLLFAVLKNMSSDSDSSRNLLLGIGALEKATSWMRALVHERRQSLSQEATADAGGARCTGGSRAGAGAGAGSPALRRIKVDAHVRAVLIQVLALLRNMAVLSTHRDEFVASGAIRGVVEVMSLWGEDEELLLNASRLLSKLSMTASCQDEMAAIKPSVHATLLQVVASTCMKTQRLCSFGRICMRRMIFVLLRMPIRGEAVRRRGLRHESVRDTWAVPCCE